MKKIKNFSGKLLLLGVDGVNVDMQPYQEVLVPDRFMENFKSCLSKVEDIAMPPKMVMDAFGRAVPEGKSEVVIKEEPVKEELESEEKVLWTKKDLESYSFSELKEIGKKLKPPVTDRSKAKLIKELLVRLNED